MKGKKIICPSCNQESVIKVVKKFEGFTVVGEAPTCAFCGYELPENEITVIEEERIEFFDDVGKGNVCRNCLNFVVNPWIQKCIIKDMEVDALDTCEKFEKKKKKE